MQPPSHGSTEKYNLSGGFQEENIEYYGVYGNISEEQTMCLIEKKQLRCE